MTDNQLKKLRAHQKSLSAQRDALVAAEERRESNVQVEEAHAIQKEVTELLRDFPGLVPEFDVAMIAEGARWVRIGGLRAYVTRVAAALDAELEEGGESATESSVRGDSFYIAPSKIDALKALDSSSSWDLKRLIRLSEEINIAHQNDCFLTVAMLVRALMDHVPPLFGVKCFEQVASNADRSVRDLLIALQSAKPICDRALHVQISRRVPLPTAQQVDLKHHVDVLLEHVIGQLP